MTAVKVKLPVIEQGATYNHAFVYLQSDNVTPIDLTGVTAKMQIRALVDDVDPLIELSTENGRIDIDTVTGRIALTISSQASTLLTPTKDALYDLELYFLDGTVQRLVEGTVTIKAEITRG